MISLSDKNFIHELVNSVNQNIIDRWALGDYRSLGRIISPVSYQLVKLVHITSQDSVLDIACGFGNTAITARRFGADVTGLDLTPSLLTLAKEEEKVAQVDDIDWKEGNAENLPFEDESFDVVLSTFGHMFASDQELTAKEMMRVLKKGGRFGFATWPPELAIGKLFKLVSTHSPAPTDSSISSPLEWGNPERVNELLSGVQETFFERDIIYFPILSPNHYWHEITTKSGSMIQLLQSLKKQNNDEKIDSFRKDYLKALEPYVDGNVLRLGYLLTIGKK